MERKPHFFFAIPLPKETKHELNKVCLSIKDLLTFNRWVHPEDYHITLAFLGSALEDKLTAANSLVGDAVQNEKSFSLHINQLGVFGKLDEPRIFWADMLKENRLLTIRDKVYSACIQAGFLLEERPFKPHITLARKWAGNNAFNLNLLKTNNPLIERPLSFEAREVVLYQTHLDQTPKYEKMAIFPLINE